MCLVHLSNEFMFECQVTIFVWLTLCVNHTLSRAPYFISCLSKRGKRLSRGLLRRLGSIAQQEDREKYKYKY